MTSPFFSASGWAFTPPPHPTPHLDHLTLVKKDPTLVEVWVAMPLMKMNIQLH